jgi:hypothetical protein
MVGHTHMGSTHVSCVVHVLCNLVVQKSFSNSMSCDWCTTRLHNTRYMGGFDSCTTPIQQLYNNPSHEDRSQYVGPTLMWRIVVQLLYWCCKSNIFPHVVGSTHMVPTHVSCVVHVLCNLVVQKSSSMNEWPRGVYIELKNNLMIFFF